MILGNLMKGADTARAIVCHVVEMLASERSCRCGTALSDAIVTAADIVPEETLKRLAPIAGRYLHSEQ